jgi:hypothetical protein
VIDTRDLRLRGALQPEWTAINSPSRNTGVEKLVVARFGCRSTAGGGTFRSHYPQRPFFFLALILLPGGMAVLNWMFIFFAIAIVPI